MAKPKTHVLRDDGACLCGRRDGIKLEEEKVKDTADVTCKRCRISMKPQRG